MKIYSDDRFLIYELSSSEGSIITSEDKSKILVNNISRINPTVWTAKIKVIESTSEINFLQSYDPYWNLELFKNNKLVKRIPSEMSEQGLNKFQIDETGNFGARIVYSKQSYFYIGLIISGITFISCVGYLIYDWRKNKNRKIEAKT